MKKICTQNFKLNVFQSTSASHRTNRLVFFFFSAKVNIFCTLSIHSVVRFLSSFLHNELDGIQAYHSQNTDKLKVAKNLFYFGLALQNVPKWASKKNIF